MKVREGLTKPSEPDKVDAYKNSLKHPLAGLAKALREIILTTDPPKRLKGTLRHFFIQANCRRSILRDTNGTSLYSTSTSGTACG